MSIGYVGVPMHQVKSNQGRNKSPGGTKERQQYENLNYG